MLKAARGIIALMGRAPVSDFTIYFGDPKSAFQNSLAAIGGSVLLIMIAARTIIFLRAALAETPPAFPALHIGLTAALYLLAFTALAWMISLIFHRREEFWGWAAMRHWVVFYALIPVTLSLVLARMGIFPLALANAILFTAFIGWLFADIRLAQKLGGLGVIGGVFAGCMIHAMGLSILLTAIVQLIA